jgi:oligopeptidase A|tara:strand:- start:218 stop:2266 length:2049 start_codon:yes stop_codon:yes gene_type:complete
MSNPLIQNNELPPFGEIQAEHVKPAIEQLLTENRTTIGELLKAGADDWESLVHVREETEDRLSQAWSPVSHMNSVVNTDDLREAYNHCLPLLSEYFTEMGQNPQLYAAYNKIRESAEFCDLSIAQQKVIDNALRDFRLSGIDLGEEQQTRLAEITKQLSELSSRFSDNVLDATDAWSKLIVDENQLAGLPESVLGSAKQAAEQRGEDGYLLTLDIPSYLPLMTYCDDSALRREVQEAFVTRASEIGPGEAQWDNSGLMLDILKLRKEQAGLLGFNNFAEKSLAKKMARSTDEVLEFLEELVAKSKPMAEKEFAELCKFAHTEYGVDELSAWDTAYFAEKLKKQKYDVSEEELRPYFPAPTVIRGMFEVVRRLFDIEIVMTDGVNVWLQDVTTYDIRKEGKVIARFYLDLYARGKKQGGAWMDECRTRRVRLDGTLQLPVAYLTCNFSPPVGDDPALLTHKEVVTLFHEFGHGIHQMLTRVECAGVSGINGVAWDVVELPSQFLENWCWVREALEFVSGHYQTGESLPDELLEKMLRAKNFQSAMAMVRQLEFALFDFRLHVEFEEANLSQIQQILDEVRDKVAVVPAVAQNRFQNAFSHIFGGGYAAGYYSYKWAEVLSADAFARFSEDGIFNRQTGEEFLSTILEQGGSRDAEELFLAFRGREPSVDALLVQDGIVDLQLA